MTHMKPLARSTVSDRGEIYDLMGTHGISIITHLVDQSSAHPPLQMKSPCKRYELTSVAESVIINLNSRTGQISSLTYHGITLKPGTGEWIVRKSAERESPQAIGHTNMHHKVWPRIRSVAFAWLPWFQRDPVRRVRGRLIN
ncbi:hypothetical protein ECG_05018 [Echinococcus granulosus]|nr:hypothetical protein ECG_05018 [Echinococcus granulosus]